MFPDIGGMEYIVVAIVALLVVKPKDLPVMMRKVGEFMGKARRMANDFRASFEDMARQSELDDLRKEVEAMRSKAADPIGLTSALRETTSEIQSTFEPTADPNFDYNYSYQAEADTSVPAADAAPPAATDTPSKPKAARKKPAPKVIAEPVAAKPVTAAKVSKAKAPATKAASPKPAVKSSAPAKRRAKPASKLVT